MNNPQKRQGPLDWVERALSDLLLSGAYSTTIAVLDGSPSP
jgi:hypothetical protein